MTHLMKLIRNLYSQKKLGRVQYIYLNKKLLTIGFEKSEINECVLYWGCNIFAFYVNAGIFSQPSKSKIHQSIKDDQTEQLYIKDKIYIEDYLVMNVEKRNTGKSS